MVYFGKRKRNKQKEIAGIVGLILIAILFLIGKLCGIPLDFDQNRSTKSSTTSESRESVGDTKNSVISEGEYTVERCVDGDTLLLTNRVRIRLIGANTPETVKQNAPVEPFGPEASEFTKKIVADHNNKVRITYDGDKIDKWGRTLAMVWFDDGILLNEILIEKGLARAEPQYRYSREMKDRFLKAEAKAKKAKLGIWSQP